MEEVLHEAIGVYGQPDPDGGEAGGSWDGSSGSAPASRDHGISTGTFYKWRSKYGSVDVSLTTQMKELEEENHRLKKLYTEAQNKADIVAEALAKNCKAMSPVRGGQMGSRGERFKHSSGVPGISKADTVINRSAKPRTGGLPSGCCGLPRTNGARALDFAFCTSGMCRGLDGTISAFIGFSAS